MVSHINEDPSCWTFVYRPFLLHRRDRQMACAHSETPFKECGKAVHLKRLCYELIPHTGDRRLTGSEASLLLSLGEVRIRVEVWFESRRCVRGLAPALPLYQVGHSALRHRCRLRHMVFHYLGNTYKAKQQWVILQHYFTLIVQCAYTTHESTQVCGIRSVHSAMCSMLHSPCREDRANAAISWMVRALLDFGNISMVSSTFTCNDKKKVRRLSSGANVSRHLNIHPANDSLQNPERPWLRRNSRV